MIQAPTSYSSTFRVSVPSGNPWQMVVVDILEVPVSHKGHSYLLVIQDYFTEWPDAILHRNKTITQELTKLFSVMDLPEILHSDKVGTLRAECYDRPFSHLESTNHILQITNLKEMAWLSDSTDLC